MSPHDTDAAPLDQLLQDLRSSERDVKRQALETLESYGPDAAALSPALSQMVLHRVQGAERIARALGRMGPDAAVAAIPVLLGLLEEPVSGRRMAASEALANIGEPAAGRAVPRLQKVLAREKDPAVREQVEKDLERFAALEAS